MFGALKLSPSRGGPAARRLARAELCAACHALRDTGGRRLSLLANDDLVLYLAVAGALEGSPRIERRPCTALPLARVGVRQHSAEVRALAAALDVALVHAKLADDVEDGDRWWAHLGHRALDADGRAALATLERLGYPMESLRSLGARQRTAEADPRSDLDALAAPTAQALGDAFAFLATLTARPAMRGELARLGHHLGRFLYLWDAVVDERRDRRGGRFNAIRHVLGDVGSRSRPRELLERDLAAVSDALAAIGGDAEAPYFEALLDSLADRVEERLGPTRYAGFPRPVAQAGAVDCCDVLDCCCSPDAGDCATCCCDPCSYGCCDKQCQSCLDGCERWCCPDSNRHRSRRERRARREARRRTRRV